VFKYILAGILIGMLIGFLSPVNISLLDAKPLLVIILVSLDVIFEAGNAKLLQQFNYLLFTNEFILNTILSLGLIYLGNVMGIDLFVPVALILIYRTFSALSKLVKTLIIKKCSTE
jgi:small basic protein